MSAWVNRIDRKIDDIPFVRILRLNPPKIIWCKQSKSPLHWHKFVVTRVYLVGGKTMGVFCPKHPEEVIYYE